MWAVQPTRRALRSHIGRHHRVEVHTAHCRANTRPLCIRMHAPGSNGGASGGVALGATSRLAEVLAADRTLDATARAFAEMYPPHERFRANCALCIMLQVRAGGSSARTQQRRKTVSTQTERKRKSLSTHCEKKTGRALVSSADLRRRCTSPGWMDSLMTPRCLFVSFPYLYADPAPASCTNVVSPPA